jgi:hypothetical protein
MKIVGKMSRKRIRMYLPRPPPADLDLGGATVGGGASIIVAMLSLLGLDLEIV